VKAWSGASKYRREYLRHEFTPPVDDALEGVTEVVPFEAVGVDFRRFAACPRVEHDTGWHKWGAAQRGAVQQPDSVLWEDTMPARYVCLFTGGCGGIDWFASSDGEALRWTQGLTREAGGSR
jgi:hypothetical protein